jgi:hypothetical protein
MSVSEAVGRLALFEESQRGRRRSGGNKDEALMLVIHALESLMKGKKVGDGSGLRWIHLQQQEKAEQQQW